MIYQGLFREVGAGLFSLFVMFENIGEPAPTEIVVIADIYDWLGLSREVGAGLFSLFVMFENIGEPAPTEII